jgi:Tol biopolymer transport system component
MNEPGAGAPRGGAFFFAHFRKLDPSGSKINSHFMGNGYSPEVRIRAQEIPLTLAAGARLGPYAILAPIGAGGMGEVYKARDTRLGRDVAVKVLPSHLSESPDLKARFEREARAIAALSHPHICAIYDVGSQEGVEYLVMELLEGQTLAERLEKGALPAEQVLKFGVEIADALDRAHRAGIVHRDLKPGNIMLTRSGVKLLDFGLAKHRAAATQSEIRDLSSLPTEASPSHPLTEQGTIMGTFQYMAPEQLEGHDADARSDIFAFGCVLFEMATGQKAFSGKSRLSLVSSILRDDPRPISSIAPMTPPALDRVVKTCLAKDPEDRFQTAHDVKLQLEWIAEAGSQAGAPAVVISRRKSRERLAWIGFGAALLLAAIFAVGFWRRAPQLPRPIVASLPLPEKIIVGEFALSPDGGRLAFTAGKPGATPGLWVRALGSATAQPVAGVEESYFPFWSPDGKFIAYFTPGSLKKIDPSGGPALTICDAERGVGGTWNRNGTIVFAPTRTSPLFRVSASGGKPAPVTKLDASRHVTAHRYPFFLPDGRRFLYMTANLAGSSDDPANAIRIGSLDGKTDTAIVTLAANASFADGYLLYAREGSLLAQRLNLGRLTLEGDPIPVAQHLNGGLWFNYSQFAASEEFLLTSPAFAAPSQMTWFDRNGRPAGTVGEPDLYQSPRLSPDGRRIAVDVQDLNRNSSAIWLYDAGGGTGTRFTSGNSNDSLPVWSPSGDRIIFGSDRKTKGARTDLWIKALDGSAEQLFLESPDYRWPEDWSLDGRSVSATVIPAVGKRNTQIWIVDAEGEHKARPFVGDAENQYASRFSPDGRWLAYASNESGRFEVYVRAFPEAGGRWQVSPAGGVAPRWRRDGKELYYVTLDNKIMAVPLAPEPSFHAGLPTLLFSIHPSPNGSTYDVTADGQRFLVNAVPAEQGSPPLSLVVHWAGLLKKD